MQKALTEEYFLAELKNLITNIQDYLYDAYKRFYNFEEQEYKKTPEYKKAKRKAYYEIPKSIREKEEMNDELAKLGYWVPSEAINKRHISYRERADKMPEPTVEFIPSMSKEEFRIKTIQELSQKTNHHLLKEVLEKIKFDDLQYPELVSLNLQNIDEKYLVNFCEHLISFYQMIGIDIVGGLHTKRQNIVTNGCEVEAIIMEQNKPTVIHVNVCKFVGQYSILGKKEGDEFKLSNIPLTYKISKIFK